MTPESGPDSSSFPARRALTISAAALLPVVLVLLLWKGAHAFLLLFAGYLLAVLLRTLARPLRRLGLSRDAGFTIVCLLLVGLGFAGWFLIGPRVHESMNRLTEELPRAVDQVVGQFEGQAWFDWARDRVTPDGDGGGDSSAWIRRATGFFGTTFAIATGALIILFVGLYLGARPRLYFQGFLHLVPPSHRERIGAVLGRVDDTLADWLKAKLLAMLLIGILTWAGLMWLEIPLPATLAVFAALLTFIPNFGPIAAAVPPVLLGLTESPLKALWVALLFLGIQTVESYLVTPLIMQEAIELPPAMILASQVLLSLLFGFLGLLVATPLVAAAMLLVGDLYVKGVLEEGEPDSEGAAERS